MSAAQGPSAEEQLLLELINRARANPAGEFDAMILNAADGTAVQDNLTNAISYFGVDLDSFRAQLDGYATTSPLAFSDALNRSALTHNELMLQFDQQSHNLPGEPGLLQRVRDAGYDGVQRVGENVYAYTRDALHSHGGFYIDWGYDTEDFVDGALAPDWRSRGDGIQDPAGHRDNMLSANFTEIGISMIADTGGSGTNVGPYLVTHHLGDRFGTDPQLLGVVIDDGDGDGFYDVGEGLGGVQVTVRDAGGVLVAQTQTWASGGYQLDLDPGSYVVTFDGDDIGGGSSGGDVVAAVEIGTANVKLDVTRQQSVEAGPSPIVGDDAPERLDGTGGGDVILGLGGADTIYGKAGHDSLMGGDGDDTLVAAGGDDVAEGGAGDDSIFGGDGDDTIDGGAGIDRMVGGEGSDTYYVDAIGDRAFENAAWAGHDIVVSAVDYLLRADHIEELRLTGDARLGRGNDGAQRIEGSDGDNLLDGSLGADTLAGGAGDDIYVVRDAGDVVIEAADGGVDTVRAMLTHRLAEGVERLLLQDVRDAGGDVVAMNGIGSSGDDFIRGNAADNVLIGRGGSDLLRGGDGADDFLFDRTLGPANIDVIADFDASEGDRVLIRTHLVGATADAAGVLDAALFAAGPEAAQADDRLVFDAATGRLSYDADGAGGTDAVQIAVLANGATLSADDVVLV